MAALRQVLCSSIHSNAPAPSSPSPVSTSIASRLGVPVRHTGHAKPCIVSVRHHRIPAGGLRASSGASGIVPGDDEDGVLLGTLKLPANIDLVRFETLLFQWANSLCQGANVPLPVPLKVDKVKGGARLGFTVIGEGKVEVPVYIDCLVFPMVKDGSASGPVFRAIRNGPKREEAPPGEPRIMRSLLQALQKSVEIARI